MIKKRHSLTKKAKHLTRKSGGCRWVAGLLSLILALGFSLGLIPIYKSSDNSNKPWAVEQLIERAKAAQVSLDSVAVDAMTMTTTTSTVTYTVQVTADAGGGANQFKNSKKYFIYAHMSLGASTATAGVNYQVVYGTTVQYTGVVEPNDTGTADGTNITWIDVYDQPATAVAVKLQFKVAYGLLTPAAAACNASIYAMNLTDNTVEEFDWEYASDSTGVEMDNNWANKATITLNKADGVRDWLVWGRESLNIDQTTSEAEMRLNNITAGTTSMYRSQQGENTAEGFTVGVMRTYTNVAINTQLAVQVRDSTDVADNNNYTGSKIFALNLDIFQNQSSVYNTGSVALGSSFTTIATLSSYQPTVTGNQVVFVSYMNDVAAAATQSDDQITVDDTEAPAGWNQTQGGGGKTSYNAADITSSSIATVISMTNSSSHHIDVNAKEISGTSQVGVEWSITVFSTAMNYIPRMYYWRWYADEATDTSATALTTAYANEITAPPQIEMGKSIPFRLRINLTESGGVAENNSRKKLYYATGVDGPWTIVGETADTNKLFRYYNGGGADNATINTRVLTGSTTSGILDESNSNSPSGSDHADGATLELEYTIENYNAVANTAYYFALLDETLGIMISLVSGANYPNLTTASAYSLTISSPASVALGDWQIGSSAYHQYAFVEGEEITTRDNRGVTSGNSSGWSLTADMSTELNYSSAGTIGSVTYTGSGLNDMTTGGTYTGLTDLNYTVEITGHNITGINNIDWETITVLTPDTTGIRNGDFVTIARTTDYNGDYIIGGLVPNTSFVVAAFYTSSQTGNWKKIFNPSVKTEYFNWNSGGAWTTVMINPLDLGQILDNGVTVHFNAGTGHAYDDKWTFTCTAGSTYTITKANMYWISASITGLYAAPTTGITTQSGSYMSSAVTAATVAGSGKNGLGGFTQLPTLRIYNATKVGNYTGSITLTLT